MRQNLGSVCPGWRHVEANFLGSLLREVLFTMSLRCCFTSIASVAGPRLQQFKHVASGKVFSLVLCRVSSSCVQAWRTECSFVPICHGQISILLASDIHPNQHVVCLIDDSIISARCRRQNIGSVCPGRFHLDPFHSSWQSECLAEGFQIHICLQANHSVSGGATSARSCILFEDPPFSRTQTWPNF